jgi:DNA-binding NtrC family response regulator
VDVRVLAATHRVLEEMCGAGTFREDLLYRLNAMTLRVPPLRERLEELSPLVRQFMQQANSANGCQVTRIDPEALVLLRRYPWPGNVRELRNVIERAVVLQREGVITANHLPERVRTYPGAHRDSRDAAPPPSAVLPQLAPPVALPLPPQGTRGPAGAAPLSLKEQLRSFEALLLVDALERCGWNKAHAARRLGMPLRTLFHKIASYGISDDGAALQPLREELATIQDPCAATGSPELRPNLQACEARLLKQAMLAAGGDTTRAARELQISPHTLAARLRALRLA